MRPMADAVPGSFGLFRAGTTIAEEDMDSLSDPVIYEFDDFVVDARSGTLFRTQPDGRRTPVLIGSRAFQILCLLIGREGHTVSRQEIIDTVWPGVALEDNNVTVQL